MALERIGSIEAAGDFTTAANIRQAGTQSQEAVDDRIAGVAAEIIASDPTVAAGAAAAVEAEVQERDLVGAGDPRLLDVTDPNAFRVRDTAQQVALEVNSNGDTTVMRRFTHGRTLTRQSQKFRIMDRYRRVALEIDGSGKVTIPDLASGSAPVVATVKRLVVVFVTGQSNPEGRGRPFGPELDPTDDRIFMWNWATSQIAPATVPLSSTNKMTGLSPATIFAREVLANEPAGTAVLIVNAAVGESGLVNATSTGKWQWQYTGSQPKLAQQAIDALTAALSASAVTFPGATVDIRALWGQGEADSDDRYAAFFDELWNGLRGIFGATMTVMLMGMVPEFVARNPAKEVVRAAHVQTPARLLRAAYVPGVPNGGYANPTIENGVITITDEVHYGREAVVKIGKALYVAWQRAVTNTADSKPTPPHVVSARSSAGQLTVSWSVPFCRATDFVVQHSANGDPDGAWTTVTGRPLSLETTATVTTANRWVRVATVNELATSNPTTPIYATGA